MTKEQQAQKILDKLNEDLKKLEDSEKWKSRKGIDGTREYREKRIELIKAAIREKDKLFEEGADENTYQNNQAL